ncbi:hypothetical protein D3C72_1133690 [compost metagenome]
MDVPRGTEWWIAGTRPAVPGSAAGQRCLCVHFAKPDLYRRVTGPGGRTGLAAAYGARLIACGQGPCVLQYRLAFARGRGARSEDGQRRAHQGSR